MSDEVKMPLRITIGIRGRSNGSRIGIISVAILYSHRR